MNGFGKRCEIGVVGHSSSLARLTTKFKAVKSTLFTGEVRMVDARNPVSIALIVRPFGKLYWAYKPDFSMLGPFYTLDQAEKALDGYLMKEDLNEC